jgi:hypothetical protein
VQSETNACAKRSTKKLSSKNLLNTIFESQILWIINVECVFHEHSLDVTATFAAVKAAKQFADLKKYRLTHFGASFSDAPVCL